MVDVGDNREVAQALGHFLGFQIGKGRLLPAMGACFNGRRVDSLSTIHPKLHVCKCNMKWPNKKYF